MLQTASRRAQRALLSRLLAGGKCGAGGKGGSPRGAATDAAPSPPTTPTTPPTTPPPYSPPPKGPASPLREVPIPTLNFWESPTRPGDWKVSQQYWFLAGVGALSTWATVKALSADKYDEDEEKKGGNGGNGNGAGESKVSSEMSPAKREMVTEQERSPVKKQVP